MKSDFLFNIYFGTDVYCVLKTENEIKLEYQGTIGFVSLLNTNFTFPIKNDKIMWDQLLYKEDYNYPEILSSKQIAQLKSMFILRAFH